MLARAAALLVLPFSAHAQIVNGDFSNDLNGWTVLEYGALGTLGTVVVPPADQRALITENDSFLILLEQTFVVPQYAQSLLSLIHI